MRLIVTVLEFGMLTLCIVLGIQLVASVAPGWSAWARWIVGGLLGWFIHAGVWAIIDSEAW